MGIYFLSIVLSVKKALNQNKHSVLYKEEDPMLLDYKDLARIEESRLEEALWDKPWSFLVDMPCATYTPRAWFDWHQRLKATLKL